MRVLSLFLLIPKHYRRAFFEYVLRPLLLPIHYLAGGIYQVLFGRSDVRRSRASERHLELEVREAFAFLFQDENAAVIPNVDIPFPEPFDYATVTVICNNLLVRIVSGRGELNVDLARVNSPSEWYDLKTVLAAARGTERPPRCWICSMEEAAVLIRDNIRQLIEGFAGSDPNIRSRLQGFRRTDLASIRQWEDRINGRLP